MATDPSTRHRVDVGVGSIDVSDRGRGAPVLLVHAGAFADWFAALAETPALSGFRLVAPVRAGYDSTRPAPDGHLTIADHARHCATVLENLGIGRAHVLGHSSGSLIALQLAADRPDLVNSLVLVEPAAATSLLPPPVAEGLGEAVGAMAATAAAGRLEEAFDTFMRVVCAEDYRDVLRATLGPERLRRAERDCAFFFRDEVPAVQEWTISAAEAARVDQPVLFVRGGAGSPLVQGIIARLAELVPHAEVATVEAGDHLLPLRAPSVLAGHATDFMNRHPVTPAD